MAKTQRHQQEALWEFVHTELTYINKLIIIKDVRQIFRVAFIDFFFFFFFFKPNSCVCLEQLVIAALVNLHQHGLLLEVSE